MDNKFDFSKVAKWLVDWLEDNKVISENDPDTLYLRYGKRPNGDCRKYGGVGGSCGQSSGI